MSYKDIYDRIEIHGISGKQPKNSGINIKQSELKKQNSTRDTLRENKSCSSKAKKK